MSEIDLIQRDDTVGAFLGVRRSVTGKLWRARPADERLALAHAQRGGLPEIVGRILAARGVPLDSADQFLEPRLKSLLPDPSTLKDMDRAAGRLARAIREGERIAVFGDYDVDGATSSALLAHFFRAIGVPLTLYIPDRIKEGYGPNAPALLRLREQGVTVVVTVDCGISAFEPLAAAREAGLEVIVIDHHKAEGRLPDAAAIVNPNRLDEPLGGPLATLAAVGVAFLLLVALNRALRQEGFYAAGREPDLLALLDLVALGTICDVVPLVGLNRALVAQGLKIIQRRANPGIAALADVAKVSERLEAYHVGFVVGPRVNAGGRVGEAGMGARILATDDPAEAAVLAARLDGYNAERRAIEAEVLEEAIRQAEANPAAMAELIFVAAPDWHPGVIGVVASRLKERFHRPACVVALEGGVGKASGRSVRGIDLGAAVLAARQAGLLINGGGHAMAAGFTVTEGNVRDLQLFLAERIALQRRAEDPTGEGLVPTLSLDGAISPAGATPELMAMLEKLGPFGTGNAEPRFALADARIVRADVVGSAHVRCIVTGAGGGRLKAIAFRSVETELGRTLLKAGGAALHLAGTLRMDRYGGAEGVQLFIDDAAMAGQSGL